MLTGSNFFLKIAMALFIVFAIVLIVQLQLQFNELRESKEEIEQNITDYKEQIAELQYELNLPMDKEYVRRVARRKMNFHLPDEIIFYNDLNN